MKKTTKAELQKEIQARREELLRIETFTDQQYNSIADLLDLVPKYPRSWAAIGEAIVELQTKVHTEGRLCSHIDHTIKAENARLWHLIRVAMNDKLVTEPKKVTGEPNFRTPDFNN